MNVFGAYCSISDEPLYDVGYVWDRNNVEHPAFQAPAENWDNLLLLSPATRDAWTRHRDNLVTSELLLPDTDSTFSLENSPFVYSLESIEVSYLDENGAALRTGYEKLVIVSASTNQAQATIDAFELNTRYFDAANNRIRIPDEDYLCRLDARLHSRTQAWNWATSAAQQLALTPRDARGPLLSQLQTSAASTGFWSVWATVLWNQFHDIDVLAPILGARSDLEIEADLVGPGPHNEFPGTAPRWLELQEVLVA